MRKQNVALIVIIGGLAVFIMKLVAYFMSNSVALFSDAMESMVNIAASILMYIAIGISTRPADANHHYGHQKAENLSAFVEGILIIIASILIVESLVGRLFSPVELNGLGIPILVSLSATSINAGLGYLMLRESRIECSMALEGDSKHLFSDVISSVGVVVGLLIADVTGLFIIDPLIALFVAAILILMGVNVIRRATVDLMDHNCPEAEEKIKRIVAEIPGITDMHYIKTRRSGPRIFAEAHVCTRGDKTLYEAEALVDQISERLEKEIPGLVINIKIESVERGSRRNQ